MAACPYCHGELTPSSDGGRARAPDQELHQCSAPGGCSGYSVIRRGKVFPLLDRTDPDTTATTRVID